jgi:hypothetical protein
MRRVACTRLGLRGPLRYRTCIGSEDHRSGTPGLQALGRDDAMRIPRLDFAVNEDYHQVLTVGPFCVSATQCLRWVALVVKERFAIVDEGACDICLDDIGTLLM